MTMETRMTIIRPRRKSTSAPGSNHPQVPKETQAPEASSCESHDAITSATVDETVPRRETEPSVSGALGEERDFTSATDRRFRRPVPDEERCRAPEQCASSCRTPMPHPQSDAMRIKRSTIEQTSRIKPGGEKGAPSHGSSRVHPLMH